MAPTTTNNTSGYNTPDSQLESFVPIHPTAARRPNTITVQSENTVYTEETITSKFFNRGADVSVSDGQYTVTPTVQSYEFQTKRNVGKTGFVVILSSSQGKDLHSFISV